MRKILMGLVMGAAALGSEARAQAIDDPQANVVEALVLRVPVVKTVYGALRDVTRLVNTDGRKGDLERVVMVDIGPGRVMGFVTQEHASLPGACSGEDLVAVYLPMSYQIGGYTLYLPRSRIEPIDLSVEAAMRIVLTGGLQR